MTGRRCAAADCQKPVPAPRRRYCSDRCAMRVYMRIYRLTHDRRQADRPTPKKQTR